MIDANNTRLYAVVIPDGIEAREICALLNISENNLWVMLHRARMALRRCLEMNWFGKEGGAGFES